MVLKQSVFQAGLFSSSSSSKRYVHGLLASFLFSTELFNTCKCIFPVISFHGCRPFSSLVPFPKRDGFPGEEEISKMGFDLNSKNRKFRADFEISEMGFDPNSKNRKFGAGFEISEMGFNPNTENRDVETVFEIVNTRTDSENKIEELLNNSGVLLSNQVVDGVLKRVRFSHGNALQALEFFYLVGHQRGFVHSSYSYDTMLYILGRSRKFDKIWEILREMRRKDPSLITTRTLQIVLARIAKVCSVRMTVESFRLFRKFIGQLDTNCFNALLRTLCQEKTMGDVRSVYHNLKRDFKPNLQTFNILLSGWKKSEEAESFFNEMIELGCKPDIVSYNCLVDALCKSKEIDKAFKIMERMRNEEIYPDLLTYTSIVGGLGLIGQPDKAYEVLKEMKEHGCYPDTAAYNAAIRNFCIAKRLGNAYKLMDEMVSRGLSPNPTTYNLFFRYFYWSNDRPGAWSLYRRMMESGCLPNTQTCMFLMRIFRRPVEQVDMALELWNNMLEKGFGSYTLVSDILFDMLCDLGKLVEAEKCFFQMVEKGAKPSSVSFKRIKVLMELANKQEALRNLTEKMAIFGYRTQVEESASSYQVSF